MYPTARLLRIQFKSLKNYSSTLSKMEKEQKIGILLIIWIHTVFIYECKAANSKPKILIWPIFQVQASKPNFTIYFLMNPFQWLKLFPARYVKHGLGHSLHMGGLWKQNFSLSREADLSWCCFLTPNPSVPFWEKNKIKVLKGFSSGAWSQKFWACFPVPPLTTGSWVSSSLMRGSYPYLPCLSQRIIVRINCNRKHLQRQNILSKIRHHYYKPWNMLPMNYIKKHIPPKQTYNCFKELLCMSIEVKYVLVFNCINKTQNLIYFHKIPLTQIFSLSISDAFPNLFQKRSHINCVCWQWMIFMWSWPKQGCPSSRFLIRSAPTPIPCQEIYYPLATVHQNWFCSFHG